MAIVPNIPVLSGVSGAAPAEQISGEHCRGSQFPGATAGSVTVVMRDVHAASGCLMGWFAGTEWWVGGGVGGQQRCSACPPEAEEKSLKMSVKFPFLSGKGWTGIFHLKKRT